MIRYMAGLKRFGVNKSLSVRNGSGKRCEKIFIAGLEKDVGCTHGAILLANFYGVVLKKKVAIIDLNKNKDYVHLIEKLELEYGKDEGGYHKGSVTFYPEFVGKDISDVIAKGFDYVIIDVGNNYHKYEIEASMSDRKMIFIKGSYWEQWEHTRLFMDNFNNSKGNGWEVLCTFGDNELISEMKKKIGIAIYRFPYIQSPFSITRKDLLQLTRIAGEECNQ